MKIQNVLEILVIRFPKSILTVMLLMTMGAMVSLLQLSKDPDTSLLARDHESRVIHEKMRETFTGTGSALVVLLEAKDTIFKSSTLKRIQQLTNAFEQIQIVTEEDLGSLRKLALSLDGETATRVNRLVDSTAEWDVETDDELHQLSGILKSDGLWTREIERQFERIRNHLSPITKVTSLANTDNILGVAGELDVSLIYEDIPQSPEELESIRRQITENELFAHSLFTPTGKHTGIFLEIALSFEDANGLHRLSSELERLLSEEFPGEEHHYIAGSARTSAEVARVIDQDMVRFFPIVMLLVIVVLWLMFRMFKGVVVPVLVVVLSLICTLGLQALFQIPINIISSALPVFLISIGVADGIHLVSEFRDQLLRGHNKTDAVRQTLCKLTQPVIMTSITTASAFWALSVTDIVKIMHFGWFVGIGTLIAMLFSLLFIPSLLLVLPQSVLKQSSKTTPKEGMVIAGLGWFNDWAMLYPKTIVTVTLCLAGIAVYGTSQLKVDNNDLAYFKQDSPLVRDAEAIRDKLAGSQVLNLIVQTKGENDPMKNPENLQAIDDLQNFLDRHPFVGKTFSLAGLVKRMNYVMNENDPAYNRIPSNRPLIAQYLLLYENGGGDTLSDVIDPSFNTANIAVTLRTTSARDISGLLDDIRTYQNQHFPQHLTLLFAGGAFLNVAGSFAIVSGQIDSFVLSLLLIGLMLIFIFRSPAKGILGIVPLLLAVLINFGLLGLMEISLDIGSAVVSSIVLGVGVDYSIHYLARLRDEMQQGLAYQEAMIQTLKHSGKAIIFNALAVGGGFLALMVSEFTPIITVGLLVSLSMVISALATLILLPALLHLCQPAFLTWDRSFSCR